jgi:hypothetical protein
MDLYRTTDNWTGTLGAIAPADGNAASAVAAVFRPRDLEDGIRDARPPRIRRTRYSPSSVCKRLAFEVRPAKKRGLAHPPRASPPYPCSNVV